MNDDTPATPPAPEPAPGPDGPPGAVPVSPVEPSPPRTVGSPDATAGRANRAVAIGLAALLVALAFGGGVLVGRGTAPSGDTAVVPSASAPGAPASGDAGASPTPVASQLPSDGPRLGLADAKVTLTVWADFQCPFCSKFAFETMPALESRIADGTLALVHRDYAFLGDESLDAAIATRCADREGSYWAMHDAVYAGQQGENQGAFAAARLEQMAAAVGLDAEDFSACLADREPLVLVLDDTAAGMRAGVTSTPTVDVNGRRFLGVPELTALLGAIDAAAAGASPAPEPTGSPIPDPWVAVPTDDRTAGAADAPVTVELWMDYQDTRSKPVAGELGPELRTRIEAGSIGVVLHDLATLGDESVAAAATVRCTADQGGPTWFVHDVLAASAPGQGSGLYVPRSLLWFAARIGLDVSELSDCIDDPAVAAAVASETAAGTAKGLTEAPAVVVLRGSTEVTRFSGELVPADVLKAIDKAIKAAG